MQDKLVARAISKEELEIRTEISEVVTKMEIMQTERDRERNHVASFRKHLRKKSSLIVEQAEEIADLKVRLAAVAAELGEMRAAEATRLRPGRQRQPMRQCWLLAREEANAEEKAAKAASEAMSTAEHEKKLESAARKAERIEAKLKKLTPAPGNRTVDEWQWGMGGAVSCEHGAEGARAHT